MKTLTKIWDELPMKSDKGTIHSYLPLYEQVLEPYRNATNVLEIGLFNGASLLMWEQYFTGRVWGIDCSETPHDGLADLRPLLKDHNILIMDAENQSEVEKVFMGVKFDVIIEDAGHHLSQQLNLYNIFKPYLSENSIYIIEDCQNLDADRNTYQNIDESKKVSILDRRRINGRYDDVVVLIQN